MRDFFTTACDSWRKAGFHPLCGEPGNGDAAMCVSLGFGYLDTVPQYLLTLGRSSVVQMCSRSEGAMRLHCDRNKRMQMHDDWPRRW